MKTIITKSGLKGWQTKLRSNYNSFEEFESYDRIYNIAKRLGYKSTRMAWKKNPTIQGSTNIKDFIRLRN